MKKIILVSLTLTAYLHINARLNLDTPGETKEISGDSVILSQLNAQFIQNFIHNDTVAHNQIIYKDFICIGSNGKIFAREDYMNDWAHGYDSSYLESFSMGNQFIRIMDDIALVRAETFAAIKNNNETIQKRTLYTDTYIKKEGRWWCIQAQLTPVVEN